MLVKFERSILNARISVPIKLSDSFKEVAEYITRYISVQL